MRTTPQIEAAEAAYKAAEAHRDECHKAVKQAQKTYDAARQAVRLAYRAKREARYQANLQMPQCVAYMHSSYEKTEQVFCIEKKTKKRIHGWLLDDGPEDKMVFERDAEGVYRNLKHTRQYLINLPEQFKD